MFRDLVPVTRTPRRTESWFDSFFDDDFFRMPVLNNDMKVDIKETEDAYQFMIEAPGVNKEQVAIEYKNEHLTVTVSHEDEVEEEKENYIRRERRSGSMCRTFRVGNIDKDKIKAKMENGILELTIPKDAAKETHYRIDIE